MMSCAYLRRVASAAAAALLLMAQGSCAQVAGTPARPAGKIECLGYYTIEMPGEFEYALMSNFSQGLGAWGSEIRLRLNGLEQQDVSISQPASAADLVALMDAKNAEQRREKQRFLELAQWIDDHPVAAKDMDPDGRERQSQRQQANRVPFAQSLPGRDAVFFPGKPWGLQFLVNGHILSTELPPQGTPAQTLDAFLSHYKPRALGEVPSGPGVCVPYGFFTAEKQPATIGLNIRLKDQPDIVVFLLARDAATHEPEDPRKLLDGLTPASTFFGSKKVVPVHAIRPLRPIKIDGNEGLGSFVRVIRKTVADPSRAFNNAAENDEDWGYFAYIPGRSGGKPGDSFNLEFKVERFGRFAKRPLTEGQFRDLVMQIAASIKRRPGAWSQE
jgi:hypothetical protein